MLACASRPHTAAKMTGRAILAAGRLRKSAGGMQMGRSRPCMSNSMTHAYAATIIAAALPIPAAAFATSARLPHVPNGDPYFDVAAMLDADANEATVCDVEVPAVDPVDEIDPEVCDLA
mmetsp:Transcript_56330/g.163401  ORF Transcript_56330/g.163401 Transcript_56330/m.163401 type:complete len:119 (-) Transcript_56330:1834-2190(-)